MPPNLDELGSRGVVVGVPDSNDLIPFYDVSELGNASVKKTLVSSIGASAESLVTAAGDMTDAQEAVFRDAIALGLIGESSIGPILPRTYARISADLLSGARPPLRVRQAAFGDSYSVLLDKELGAEVSPFREYGFGQGITLSSGSPSYDQWAYSPVGGTTWNLTGSGQTATFNLALECYRVRVFYTLENGGGTFSLQTNTAGAGWVDVPGATAGAPLNANNGGSVSAGVFTYDFTTSASRQVRAVWQSGTVRIIGFALSDIRSTLASQKGGIGVYDFSLGGTLTTNYRLVPQAVWDAILPACDIDFATFKSDDSYDSTLAEWVGKVNTAKPLDWVFISRHPSNATSYALQGDNAGNRLLSMDNYLRDFAIAQNQYFFNARQIFPDHATMVDAGLIADLDPHLSDEGQAFANRALMTQLKYALVRGDQNLKADVEASFITGSRYQARPFGTISPLGQTYIFDSYTNSGSGTSFKLTFAMSKLDEVGTTGFHFGQNGTCSLIQDQYGQLFHNHGTAGFGNGFPTIPRPAEGSIELHSGNRLSSKVLVLSGATSHTGDLMGVYEGASTTVAGTRRAGITAAGIADFRKLKLTNLATYADNAAALAGGLVAGDVYRTSTGVLMITY